MIVSLCWGGWYREVCRPIPGIPEECEQPPPLPEQPDAAGRESSARAWSSAQPGPSEWTWHNPEGWARHSCRDLLQQQNTGNVQEDTRWYQRLIAYIWQIIWIRTKINVCGSLWCMWEHCVCRLIVCWSTDLCPGFVEQLPPIPPHLSASAESAWRETIMIKGENEDGTEHGCHVSDSNSTLCALFYVAICTWDQWTLKEYLCIGFPVDTPGNWRQQRKWSSRAKVLLRLRKRPFSCGLTNQTLPFITDLQLWSAMCFSTTTLTHVNHHWLYMETPLHNTHDPEDWL